MGSSPSFPRVTLSKDQIVIVTGANTGIGYHTAKWMAMMGATVILACRSEEKALRAINQMNEEFKEEKRKGTPGIVEYDELCVEFMKLDCASLQSVVDFANSFKGSGRKLDTLILNAGLAVHKQAYTEDGHEMHFQVNYLSQFLLTAHLLPVMKSSGDDCRIILVSSVAHRYHHYSIDTVEGKQYDDRSFGRLDYYGRSKLYQIWQMFSMNRRLKNTNVTVLSLHPGVVETELPRNFQDVVIMKNILYVCKAIGYTKNAFEGAYTTLNAAVNPELKGVRDVYYNNSKPAGVTSCARNEKYQEEMWKYSMECLKEFMTDDLRNTMEGQECFQTI